jgi:NAD(P)-dependent dehydrogenase (short-subunit alcohol dehydrogenase family)
MALFRLPLLLQAKRLGRRRVSACTVTIQAMVVLITGATSGLGRAVAGALAERGHTVLVHGRDAGRIEQAVGEIGAGARGYRADLASLAQVRQLAGQVAQRQDRLDVLINSAGIATTERQDSADGIELDFAVDYLSHWLLTGYLLPLLRQSAPARIVNVASIGQAPIDWRDPLLERTWDWYRAYAQSKLAQIMFTFELAGRLPPEEVTVNALHPATLMDTKMVHATSGRAISAVEDGVGPVVRLATGDEVAGISGRYFDRSREARADEQAYDLDSRRRLWELSVELTGEEDPYAR